MHKTKRSALFVLFIFLCGTLHSQTRISAPYSIFGVGELQQSVTSRNLSMGGIYNGIRHPLQINYVNPASYTSFDKQSFLFEANLAGTFKTQKTETISQSHNYASPGSFLLGFPITKNIGTSIGLVPYSKVGYKVTNTVTNDDGMEARYKYEGDGGLNIFYMGTGIKLSEKFSAGINAGYMFGKINKTKSVDFPLDTLYFYGFKENRGIYPQGFYFDIGLQYHEKLKEGLSLNIGAEISPEANLNVNREITAESFITEIYGKDTIRDIEEDGKMAIPISYSTGITLHKKDAWLIGADFSSQQWEDYRYFGEPGSHLTNNYSVSLGGKYIPNKFALKNFLNKIEYQAGLRYRENYILMADNPFNEFGVSFGLGIPIYKKHAGKSIINIGGEYGTRGALEKNGYKENFFNFVFSINIYEIWFIKRKYD